MLLTRIWGVILACLATFFLAGMFLVASGGDEDFTEADEAAIQAIAEAGLAALEAQILAHPVEQTSSVLYDPRIREALERTDDAVEPGQLTLGEHIAELTEQLRVRNADNTLTVALVGEGGEVKAANGVAEPNLPELLGTEAVKEVTAETEAVFSIILAGELYVVKISKADETGNRLVGVGTLNTGAGSTFRRVLGSSSPAALVRKGKLVGDIIGDQPVSSEIELLAKSHASDAPSEGASKAFRVGEGMDARIGSLGRLPGPAGRTDEGVLLVVMSGKTAAAGKRDLATTLRQAREQNALTQTNFIMLIGLLLVTAGLAFYLPTLEGTGPLSRLRREFDGIAQGAQHALFHDRYGGPFGPLARSANAAHEALRQAYLAELEIEEEELEANPTAPRPRTTGRTRRPTRGHQRLEAGRRRPRSSKARHVVPEPRETPDVDAPEASEAQPAPAPESTEAASESAAPDAEAMATAPRKAAPDSPGAGIVSTPSRSPTPVATPVMRPPPGIGSPEPSPPQPPEPSPPQAPEPSESAGLNLEPPPLDPAVDPNADPTEAYYQEVFEEFLQVKQACGESTVNFTFDKFAKKLAKQTAAIKAKREGVADVKFTVYVKDGKAALRAKVIKA